MKRDPGLQPERTALAWRRTALAMLVNGGLLVRAAVEARAPGLGTVAVLVVLASILMFAVGAHRHQALTQATAPPAPHAAIALLLLAAVWLACGAALISLAS